MLSPTTQSPVFSDEAFTSPEAFYREHHRNARLLRLQTGRCDNMRQQLAEDQYYCAGKPYYRLYPEMLAALAKINIDIDAGLLRLPFPAFRIDFPRDTYREHDDAPYIRGMLVTGKQSGDKPIRSTLDTVFRPTQLRPAPSGIKDPSYITIDADFGDEERILPGFQVPCKPFVVIETVGGRTIHEHIIEAFDHSYRDGTQAFIDDQQGYFPGQEFMASWARIAVGIAFFAINRHEVVIRDIPAALKRKLDNAKASRSKKRITKARSRLQPFYKGFTVGKELLVPRTLTDSDDGEHTGRELNFAHLRTGHMRWQAHGSGMQDRKLIFIHPTIVRKDLPMSPEPTPRGVRYDDA